LPSSRERSRAGRTRSLPSALQITRITPVLFVDAVEPSLAFWHDRLGFTVPVEVPGDNGSAVFAILERNGLEVMLQTWASIAHDVPALASARGGASASLYLEVDDIEAALRATTGLELIAPRSETFYGTIEFTVREPGGHPVTFAARKGEA